MKINDDVELIQFNGTLTSLNPQASNEDYWKLIGERGIVIEPGGKRVLVKFECDLDSYGLENHNPIKNSLWILRQDLKSVSNE
ncbi:hypothetical protein [Fulvivirga ligni]|uniref:hypothetical protein n=1 Tax=Fulvivirga ligni TaxID=2904246 RepID=UPI001F2FF874|nr:hypothetical protein [Fulvivirga ligni]UII20501.1 hypothetical protein LVD16_21925 [Fulvivirga ligni]